MGEGKTGGSWGGKWVVWGNRGYSGIPGEGIDRYVVAWGKDIQGV